MKRDDIMRMAHEAGIAAPNGCLVTPSLALLEKFAALVAAAEREACADKAETMSDSGCDGFSIADAIRKRGAL